MSLLQLLLKPANRNLLEVIASLPNLGVGSRVTRKSWEPYGNSYYEITAVKPRNDDGSAGKVYGVLTWRGERAERPSLIRGRTKKVWRWMPPAAEQAHLMQLARQLQSRQDLQQIAAAKAAAAAADAAGGTAAAAEGSS